LFFILDYRASLSQEDVTEEMTETIIKNEDQAAELISMVINDLKILY